MRVLFPPSLVALAAVMLLSACAARAPLRPMGDAAPDPTAAQIFADVTKACRGLQTLTAEIALSGRAAGERIRSGRLHAGFAAPESMRLEAMAPFGPPVFILGARDGEGTLLFPRDNRVLPETPVAAVLERLTGLDLGADDLRLVLSGCLAADANPTEGRSWPDGWKAVTLAPGRVAYLRQIDGAWVVVAADYDTWRVDYGDRLNGWPRTVRVRATEGAGVDLTARLAQLQVNVDLPPSAFVVDVPAGAERLTLEDLRGVAPLRK